MGITTSTTKASKARFTQGPESFVTSTDNAGNELQAYKARAIVQVRSKSTSAHQFRKAKYYHAELKLGMFIRPAEKKRS